ncbi:hypothetical protein HCU40_11530 [Pseudanabaena biceps]|nr:hypothetical protein [Pseudanabaena biceps]
MQRFEASDRGSRFSCTDCQNFSPQICIIFIGMPCDQVSGEDTLEIANILSIGALIMNRP